MTDLYTNHAEEFSATRKAPWVGWNRLLSNEKLIKKEELTILDLGCGNARFLRAVMKSNLKLRSYLGVDNSSGLLGIANKEIKEQGWESFAQLKNIDLEQVNWASEIKNSYNLITAFGLVHHFHTNEQRLNLYKYASELLDSGGIFCITFWQFVKNEKLAGKSRNLDGNNDYELPFGNNGAKRFVHYTDESEIQKLESSTQLTLIDEYYSDGAEGNLNLYKIYQKA